MARSPRLAVLTRDFKLSERLALRLQGQDYQVVPLGNFSNALGLIYSDPPDILIVDLSATQPESLAAVKELKEDSYFCMIPVMGLIKGDLLGFIEWEQYPLDDFLICPFRYPELFARISLLIQRSQRVQDHNPLTKLPGNTSIQKAVEGVLGKPMAVCYLDINHFKPYNDTYGFARGDEVIRMVGRILSNSIRSLGKKGFAGHIGGDDFVFIAPFDQAESVCRTVLDHFRLLVSDLFGEDEKARGYYTAKDRNGSEQQIPLLTAAIGIVPTAGSRLSHYGKVAELAAELKHLAKQCPENRYVVDRRKK